MSVSFSFFEKRKIEKSIRDSDLNMLNVLLLKLKDKRDFNVSMQKIFIHAILKKRNIVYVFRPFRTLVKEI